MSLPPETWLDLMALADGELEGEARERAEKLVADSAEARQAVEQMRSRTGTLGSWLEEALSEETSAADGIADAVMARLEAKAVASPPPRAVVRLADVRARRVPRPAIGVTLALLGVAAAVALYLRSSEDRPYDRSPVASVGGSNVDVEAPPTAFAKPREDVEVNQVESEHDITLFSIPLGGAAAAAANPGNPSTVVIVIEDDPAAQ